MNRPWVIAHRGASAHAPENTLAAFELARRQGADGFEFDVWSCKTGEVVVTHDEETRRLTGRPGHLKNLSLKELRRLDYGRYKGAQFRGERIPTLNEVLDLGRHLPILNIEIKGRGMQSSGVELSVLESILKFRLLRRVVVSSFNPAILFRMQRLNPAVQLGLLVYEKSPLALRRAWSARFLKLFSLHPSFGLLDAKLVKRQQDKGHRIITWTINNLEQFRACMALGLDGMITDDPAWMINAMRKK